MKSKKRYVIAFWIAASLVVALGIGMVAVLAAFQATTAGGNFSISYTAYNVKAHVEASFKKPGDTSYTKLEATDSTNKYIEFVGTETEGTTKSFKNMSAMQFTKTNREAYLCYTIKNNNTTGGADAKIKVSKDFTGPTVTGDITVKYAVFNDRSAEPTISSSDWKDLDSAWTDGTAISEGKTLYFYVKITLDAKDYPAQSSISGAFNFSLAMA